MGKEELQAKLAGLGLSAEVVEEFELLSIAEESAQVAREVAKKVQERVESYARLLEELLQPDPTVGSMQECSFIDEGMMVEVRARYRMLMRVLRLFTEANLVAQENSYKEFVLHALGVWSEQKEFLISVAKKLQAGWQQEQTLHVERGYLG